MEKQLNNIEQTKLSPSNLSLSNGRWLDEHAKLIQKLESAYTEPAKSDKSSSDIYLYGLDIAGLNLILNGDAPCELIEENDIFEIPLSADWIIGVSNIRGDAIPIIDLERLLGTKEKKTTPNQYKTIILGQGESAFGLLSMNLPKSILFEKNQKLEDFSKLPEQIRTFVEFGYIKDQKTWVCVDFYSFLKASLDINHT